MSDLDVLIPAGVMAVLRREQSVRGLAERMGVTEAQVREWEDVFVIAGALALAKFCGRGLGKAPKSPASGKCGAYPSGGDPTTPDMCEGGDPTTPDMCEGGDPTTPDMCEGGDPTTPDISEGGDPTTPDFDGAELLTYKSR